MYEIVQPAPPGPHAQIAPVPNKLKTALRLLRSGDFKSLWRQIRLNGIHLRRTYRFHINGVVFRLYTEGEDFELMEMPEELRSLEQFGPGDFDAVIVAGAHTGRDPLYFAGIARRVIAFEPHPRNFQPLQGNVALNRRTNITLKNMAISDADSTHRVHRRRRHLRCGTAVLPGAPAGGVRTITVTAARLDSLVEEMDLGKDSRILLWMDIEGAELRALEGAVGFLREHRPVVHPEIHPIQLARQGRSPDDVRGRLAELGYRDYRVVEKSRELHALAFPD